MKALFSKIFVAMLICFSISAIAQTYPVKSSTTFAASGVAVATFKAANLSVASLRVTGTCTSLPATNPPTIGAFEH